MFDAQAFLESTVTEANDTKVVPVPQGEYTGLIDKLEAGQWQSKDGTKSGFKISVTWAIDNPEVKAFLGRDNVTVRQDIMLDVLEDGRLDTSKGKNVGLGRLREAVDLNQPGQPFSFNMLPGRVARIGVTHRVYNDDTFAEVKTVARM